MDRVSQYAVTSADGTIIAAWCNDGEGIPLLICNGLASSPAAFPALRDPDCGFEAGPGNRASAASRRSGRRVRNAAITSPMRWPWSMRRAGIGT